MVSLFSGRRKTYSTKGAATKPEPSNKIFLPKKFSQAMIHACFFFIVPSITFQP